VGRDQDLQPVEWDGRPGFGLGNLEADARWTVSGARPADGGWRTALVARAALPTGPAPFRPSGAALGLQAVAARGLGSAFDVYLGAGATTSSEDDGHGIAYE